MITEPNRSVSTAGDSCWMGMERIEKFESGDNRHENEEESYRWGRSSPAHHRQQVPCRVSESSIYNWGCSQDTNFILWFRCLKNLGDLQTIALWLSPVLMAELLLSGEAPRVFYQRGWRSPPAHSPLPSTFRGNTFFDINETNATNNVSWGWRKELGFDWR